MQATTPPLRHAWRKLLAAVMEGGDDPDAELRELRQVTTAFSVEEGDLVDLSTLGLRDTLAEMRKVFFTSEPNRFGHSYRSFWRGPSGRSDLTDIIKLLSEQPSTKRALLVLVDPNGKHVPCLNALHFLIRHGRLEVGYFARGQDVYLKFCADAICVHELGRKVASQLNLEIGAVTGTISSAHIYRRDFERVAAILNLLPQH